MTTILLTGKTGQIGQELQRSLAPLGNLIAPGRSEMSLADPASIRAAVRDARPDIVVNAAGYTTVDKAESEPELAMLINARSTEILAEAARKAGAFLLHFSSAYVFDGATDRAYVEEDLARPVNVYGKTKLAAEHAVKQSGVAHIILRLSWVYCDHGRNFLLTMQKLARERASIDVVKDHIASPTWARCIANATRHILASPRREGTYHYSAGGEVSRYGWTLKLYELMRSLGYELDAYPAVRPVPASEYPDTAVRPAHCVMSNAKIERDYGIAIVPWEEQLRSCLEDMISRRGRRMPA